jgi:hypothetical protein
MELKVEGETGAGYREKSPERSAQRNSYRDRIWETRAGAVELRIPKLRKGTCFPGFLKPRGMARRSPSRRSRDPVGADHDDRAYGRSPRACPERPIADTPTAMRRLNGGVSQLMV